MAELDETLPRNSVFHPDNIAAVQLLTLLQIKDYLAVIAAKVDLETTDAVEELHESGQFLCPPPLFPDNSGPSDG